MNLTSPQKAQQPSQQMPIEVSTDKTQEETVEIKQALFPVPEKVDRIELQKLEVDYRLPEHVDYFCKKDKIKKTSRQLADSLLTFCFENMKDQIKQGYTAISEESKDLTNYTIAHSPRKDKSQQKETSKPKMLELPPPPPEHKQFIERMKKVRQISENRRKLTLEYDQQKRQQFLKKKEEERHRNEEQQRGEREKQFKEKMEELSKRKEKSKEEQIQSFKRYKSVIHQKKRHEIMAQKYENSVLLPMLEDKKKKLQERSQRIKGYSIDDIREFEKEYVRRQQERLQSQPKKDKESWEYKAPPIHPRLHQLIQQQKIREQVKLEQKKRALEEKISRQENYVQYLKQSIFIKIDQKKKRELQLLNAPKPNLRKSEEEMRSMGNNYLKQLRGKTKKDKKDSYSIREQPRKELSVSQSKFKSNTSMGHYSESIKKIKESRINRLISSNSIEKTQKLEKLKQEIDKLSEQAKRKQEIDRVSPKGKDGDATLEVLLSNVKAKVGIVNLYRN